MVALIDIRPDNAYGDGVQILCHLTDIPATSEISDCIATGA